MQTTTNDTDTRQARRIAQACKDGAQSCAEIISSLLDGRPDLTQRQRGTVVRGAVLLARYGVGCSRCKAQAKNMHPEVRAAYVEKYGSVNHVCDVCKDTGTDKRQGLRCLACDHLTPLELSLLIYFSTGDKRPYEALMGQIGRLNPHIPPSLVVKTQQRLISIGAAEREAGGEVVITKAGHRRAKMEGAK
jgi:hypothetical protein